VSGGLPDNEPAHYLGVDIGGTKVALRIEAGDRCVAETAFRWSADHTAEQDLARLAEHVAVLRTRLGVPFRAVGVAMPATVGPDERVTAWPSRPAWTGLALGAALRALFGGIPVGWADDGDLGALAEARAAGCDDLLYVGVGTGVGGGLVLAGLPCPGLGRGSFEVGHLVVRMGGARCRCGRRGCLQAVASGPATLERAARLRGDAVAYDELCAAVREGESWAVTALSQTCRALATAVVSVQELLHPQLVIVGGGFAAGVPSTADLVQQYVSELARPGQPTVPVRPALLGGLSSLRGAVALARLL
jgi:kanosamine 6-kinase